MPKFSGKRNATVYSANGRWRCYCGRTFLRSKKCLKCGDKLPYWINDGTITMSERNLMEKSEYGEWMEQQLIAEATKDIQNWIGGT